MNKNFLQETNIQYEKNFLQNLISKKCNSKQQDDISSPQLEWHT